MHDTALMQLLKEDRRYPLDAYIFVFQALGYAQNVLGMGTEGVSEPPTVEVEEEETDESEAHRHVTGQELCEAIRQFAIEQYGYMAKTVLANWGIRGTGDFGNIVFNMIRIGRMRKTSADCREDFDDVYDFDTAFQQDFRFAMPE